eukprot:CAMPEP_0206232340 /NCGR_PEP_ID=MMETSP0047_2-20121206/11360_1 /ASSEMBLY_ACC=CAM_ASM_000192 /TAXON_ID=195065 /ORGANISM="Chroomonas mesostigmatica_cf, Strain CCMP1168" /LENGTH=838 /DNA_ID=CAMNT_0053656063 /DNA_START=104 /DNA_END=2621 /DNA_ORIENTATION=-
MSGMLTVKASFGDELRRFDLPDRTVEVLRAQAAARFGFPDGNAVRLQYKDDEGDLVDISTDDELHSAVQAMSSAVLRVSVSPASIRTPRTSVLSSAPPTVSATPVTEQPLDDELLLQMQQLAHQERARFNDQELLLQQAEIDRREAGRKRMEFNDQELELQKAEIERREAERKRTEFCSTSSSSLKAELDKAEKHRAKLVLKELEAQKEAAKKREKEEKKTKKAAEKEKEQREKEAKREARKAEKAAEAEATRNLILQTIAAAAAGSPASRQMSEPMQTQTEPPAQNQTQTQTVLTPTAHTHVQTAFPSLAQTQTQTAPAPVQAQTHTQTAPPATQTGEAQASGMPTEQHLQSLLRAVVETLSLPADVVYAKINSTTPEDIRSTMGGHSGPAPLIHMIHDMIISATLGATPLPFPPMFGMLGNLFPGMRGMGMGGGGRGHRHGPGGARPHCGGRPCGGDAPPQPTIDTAPELPEGVLQPGATGEAVTALQKNLFVLGFLEVGPRFFQRWCGSYEHKTQKAVAAYQAAFGVTGIEHGVYCEETRASMLSKLESLREEARAADRVEITDTDGDVMVFELVGGKVRESVNGKVDVEHVTAISVDAAQGRVTDQMGRFTIKPEEKEAKIAALRALLARSGVTLAEEGAARAAEQTVNIDIDLEASPADMERQRARAEEAVRRACAAMGARPEAALGSLQRMFAMAGGAAGASGEAAASQSISRAAECLASVAADVAAAVGEAKEEMAAATAGVESQSESDSDDSDEYVDVDEPPPLEEPPAGEFDGPPPLEDCYAAPPAGEFADELAALAGMGFEGDCVLMVEALRKHNGDLSAVVADLLSV